MTNNFNFCYRITKYDPRYRNIYGVYIRDDWTTYSDVGKFFHHKKLTFKTYQKVEDAYVNAILLFMECLNVSSLTVLTLQLASMKGCLNGSEYNKGNLLLTKETLKLIDSLKTGISVDKNVIITLARLNLREFLWCNLGTTNMYVHFCWDLYMYLGSMILCNTAIQKITDSGLFIEECTSAYSPMNDC
jgi:hypothetical protein